MLKQRHLTRWAVLALIGLLLSGLGLVYLQQQISQMQAAFPHTGPVALADDKGYGVTLDMTRYSPADLQAILDEMQAVQFSWIRQPLPWADIEPEPNLYQWQAYDQAIEAADLRGFKLIAVLETSPEWARAAGTPPHTPPSEVGDFGRFAQQVARRYGDKIDHYQIWHEPNLTSRWGNRAVSPADYTLLLKNAAIHLRQVDPTAKILTAALAPTTENGPLNLNEMAFLDGLYQAKAGSWFDIVAAQLYGFHLPISPVVQDAQTLNIHRVVFLREIMVRHGDAQKPIWATAFGWHTLPENWSGQPTTWPSDTPTVQRERTQEALSYMRANWPWLGPRLVPSWNGAEFALDDPARGFAVSPELLTPFKVAQHQLDTASVGFYPPTHRSGQYSPGWERFDTLADLPIPSAETRPATLTIPFDGTRLDLHLNRGPFRGYLWVTIDGEPSSTLPQNSRGRSYVVLYDPLRESETVTLAQHLSDGPHTAVIEAEGGWGQWVISGWAVYRQANSRQLSQFRLMTLGLFLLSTITLLWQSLAHWRGLAARLLSGWQVSQQAYGKVDDRLQCLLPLIFGLGFYLLPAPIDLLCLMLVGVTIMLRLEGGLLLLAFSVSFFLGRKSLPIGQVPLLEFALLVVLMAVSIRLVIKLIEQPQALLGLKLPIRPTDWAALALVGLGLVATLNAVNFGVSNFELRTVVIGSVAFYFLLRLIPWLADTDRASLTLHLTDAFVAGATLHAATALYQYYLAPAETIDAEGVRRALGYFYGSPNNLSLFLDRALPILLAVALFGVGQVRRLSYGLGLGVVSVALFLTFSKGALFIAIPASLLFVALLQGGRLAWLGAGSGLIMLGMALIPISRTERFQSTFSLSPGSTTFFRLRVWQSGWEMLKDFPLTGVGLDNFLYQYRTRYILPDAWQEPNLSHPHNLFLDFGTRLGVGGILLLVWLLWLFWGNAIRLYRRLDDKTIKAVVLGWMGSMVAFFLHGLIDNSYFLVDLAYTFFLALGIVEMLRNES